MEGTEVGGVAGAADASEGEVRRPDGQAQPVTFAELFFDLVYVVGVTQLASRVTGDLTWGGAFQSLVLLLALWWAWVSTAWFTNAFDPDQRPVRVVLILVMLASLVMTAAVPEAFGARGAWFAGAYVAIQVGRSAFAVVALRRRRDPGDDSLRRSQQRSFVWAVLAAVPWLAGGLASGRARMGLWLLALAIDYGAPVVGFRVPGLGRSDTTDWDVEGQHLAERCQLFLIVAFGESILATGARSPTRTRPRGGRRPRRGVRRERGAVVGVLRPARRPGGRHARPAPRPRAAGPHGVHLPPRADGRGRHRHRRGRQAGAGRPDGATALATAVTVLGGPALFVAGHALFKRALFGMVSVPRLARVAGLGLLGPVAVVVSPLALSLFATVVVAAVAVWDVARPPALVPGDVAKG